MMLLNPLTKYHAVALIAVISHVTIVVTNGQETSLLSAQCISETEQLASIEAVKSTIPSAECTINLDVGNSCTADFEPLSSNFKDACITAGGRFYTTNIQYDCTTFAFGEKLDADYTYLSFPACVGLSCTDTELEAYYSNKVHPYMEESFTSQGLTCEVSGSNELEFGGTGSRDPNAASSDATGTLYMSYSKSALTSFMLVTALFAL